MMDRNALSVLIQKISPIEVGFGMAYNLAGITRDLLAMQARINKLPPEQQRIVRTITESRLMREDIQHGHGLVITAELDFEKARKAIEGNNTRKALSLLIEASESLKKVDPRFGIYSDIRKIIADIEEFRLKAIKKPMLE